MARIPMDLAPGLRLAPISSLRRQIDDVFTDFSKGLGFTPLSLDEADYEFRPKADVHDDGSTTTLRLELPGIEIKDVTLEVIDDTLAVSGEKKIETKINEGDRYRSERSFGTFYRAFSFAFPIDAGKVEATFDKGILTIKVPTSAERPAARKIAIKA